MPRILQAHQVNPAQLQDNTLTLSLPTAHVAAAHTGASWQDIVRPVAGSDSFSLDIPGAISQLRDLEHLRVSTRADWLAVGIRVRNWQFHAAASTRVSGKVSYTQDMAALAWYGNAPFAGETLDLAPDFQATAFHEAGAGVSFPVLKIFRAGVRVKYLIGLADISVSRRSLTLATGAEDYRLDLMADYQLNTSMVSLGTADDFAPAFSPAPLTRNRGLGADIGIEARPGKTLTLTAGVLDLGYIRWQDQANQYHLRGTISLQGLDAYAMVRADSVRWDQYLDSLTRDISISASAGAYTRALPARLYASALWKPVRFFQAGALVQGEVYQGTWQPSLTVHAGFHAGKVLSAGLSWSYMDRRVDHLGANLLLKAGPVVIFGATDHLSSLIWPRSARQVDARLGLLLAIGGGRQ
ncbi:MAG: DUF5723 family protein [Bacteroidia bacterium]|nr:DUF5723 family protein [Bacteroidia bacterium]